MSVTTDTLLDGVKNKAMAATNQITLNDDDIIKKLNDVIKVHVVPMVNSANGEYFVTEATIDIVAGTSKYAIPYRAIGRSVRDVLIIDSNGEKYDCPYIEPTDVHLFSGSALEFGHTFQGDRIQLIPDVPATFNGDKDLFVTYKIRPSALVKLTNAGKVVSVSSPNVEVDSVGDIATDSVIDFIAGESGNRIISIDKTCTNVAGTTLTFAAADIPSELATGDYISIKGTSPVVTMIPDEASPYIERLAAKEFLLSVGDIDGARSFDADLSMERKNLLSLIQPRNPGEPKIIINRRSLVRGGKFSKNRWIYGSV